MDTNDQTNVMNNKVVEGRREDHLDLLQYFPQEKKFLAEKTECTNGVVLLSLTNEFSL